MDRTTISIQTIVNAPIDKVWESWTNPKHIMQWNNADASWHTTSAENNLQVGGTFKSRMEAKDGSMGFDFEGVYEAVEKNKLIQYVLGDGRNVRIDFKENGNQTEITELFEAEEEHPINFQRDGWQSILDNFKKYTEAL